MRSLTVTLSMICAFGGLAVAQEATETAAEPPAARVYLDCQSVLCDFDFFRNEIAFVSWVRDRRDADVHVLITDRESGSGGREYSLQFIGGRDYAGQADTLTYLSSPTDTEVETRSELVRTVGLGLVRFVAKTPTGRRLAVTYDGPPPVQAATTDPWNLWVFTVGLVGNVNAESEQRSFSGNGSFRANRTAEDWKIDFFVTGRASRDETDVPEDDTTFVSTQEFYSFDGLAVRSLGRHWSAGLRAFAGSSTFINTDFSAQAGAAVEYNIYPYSESTTRLFTVLYTVGIAAFDYIEETVFGVTSEVRPKHVLDASLVVQQAWGSVNAALQASQFLDDLSKHQIMLAGGFQIRLFRGLNLNVAGGASRVKDQLFIPGRDLTPAERLQRTRQFETDFLAFGSIGFTFQFGSKLANIVNPRLSAAGRGLIF